MAKELICKLCNKKPVKVSDQATSATCSDCINRSLLEMSRAEAQKAIQPSKKSSRYKFRGDRKKGHWSNMIDPLLLQEVDTKQIVDAILKKEPEADPARLRQLVYIRRGALKSAGQLKEKVNEQVNSAT